MVSCVLQQARGLPVRYILAKRRGRKGELSGGCTTCLVPVPYYANFYLYVHILPVVGGVLRTVATAKYDINSCFFLPVCGD